MSSPGRLSCEPGRELGGCSARPAPGPRQAGQQAGSGGGGLTGRRGAAALAVQAALLGTHPFVPFGFGGSPDGLGGGAFGAPDKGCCFEADETRALAAALLADTEGGDVPEATRDLLGFIGSASSASR